MKAKSVCLACIFSAMLVAAALPFDARAQQGPDKAPDFVLKDLQGRFVSLETGKSKAVVLVFFATWCPPCKQEVPALNTLSRRYSKKGLQVLAITTEDDQKKVRDFVAQYEVAYPVMIDKGSKVSRLYRVSSIPVGFLINANGTVVKRFFGSTDWLAPENTSAIDRLLK